MSQVSHLLHPWKWTWNTTVKLWFRWFSFSIWVIFRRPSRSTSPGRKQAPKCWVISVEFWCWSWGNHLIWSWSWVIWFEWYPKLLMWFLCLKLAVEFLKYHLIMLGLLKLSSCGQECRAGMGLVCLGVSQNWQMLAEYHERKHAQNKHIHNYHLLYSAVS